MDNDAIRFLKAGYLMASDKESFTIADGVRKVSLGRHIGKVLTEGLTHIIKVQEKISS